MDIAKCQGTGCPFRYGCARFVNDQDGLTTVWDTVPFDGQDCEEIIPVRRPPEPVKVVRN